MGGSRQGQTVRQARGELEAYGRLPGSLTEGLGAGRAQSY